MSTFTAGRTITIASSVRVMPKTTWLKMCKKTVNKTMIKQNCFKSSKNQCSIKQKQILRLGGV